MNTHDRKVYEAVLLRASPNGYPQCEECGRTGWLEMAHLKPKGMGGDKHATTTENVKLLCKTCHDAKHGIRTFI